MVDEKFRIECENMFGRNLKRIEKLEKITNAQVTVNSHHSKGYNSLEDVLRKYFKYRKDWSEAIMKRSFNESPLNSWLMISLHKLSKDMLEKLDSKKEYIASLNDPKAFEAVNLGVLKRDRNDSGSEKSDEDIPVLDGSDSKNKTDTSASKHPEPIDPCISCPDNDICEEECELSKDAKKEYQKYAKLMREEEKDDYDNCLKKQKQELIALFLKDYRQKKKSIKDYVRRSFYDCEESDALLPDTLFSDLEEKWEEMREK